MKEILIISGPTASGKSSLALKLAEKYDGVIINADSIQLYQELPILSAQPSQNDQNSVPHFLYSILKFDQISSVANWLKLVIQNIDQALTNNKLPIVVGGTGLYISKLIDGINVIPEISFEIKNSARTAFEEGGRVEFIKNLIAFGDKKELVEDLDPQRLIRRFEILKQTGKTIDFWQAQPSQKFYPTNQFVHVNLNPDRELLYQNCNKRFEIMLKNGAEEEVKKLMNLRPSDDLPILKTIGYFEIRDYLLGKISKISAAEIASQKTRNYAKRQLTWFRNQFTNKIELVDFEKELSKICLSR